VRVEWLSMDPAIRPPEALIGLFSGDNTDKRDLRLAS